MLHYTNVAIFHIALVVLHYLNVAIFTVSLLMLRSNVPVLDVELVDVALLI